ncbi:hypothetical protein NQ317_017855 [Molorchus minor]|uniref:Uncharacterized protein n=1 Tax=Molorchus minor TaxID=1323400 RepID=A0ABQ9K2E0_9CUCU|nr:hypothetical protein NQ317_017855 [Molorchus minor]
MLELNINNTPLPTTKDNVKFLGLNLDKNLNWKYHCETLVSKLASVTYLFRNIRTVLCIDQLICLYYAQVESRLREHHNVNTRQRNDFYVSFARLKITCDSPNYVGPKFFNCLPEELKCIKNECLFKISVTILCPSISLLCFSMCEESIATIPETIRDLPTFPQFSRSLKPSYEESIATVSVAIRELPNLTTATTFPKSPNE